MYQFVLAIGSQVGVNEGENEMPGQDRQQSVAGPSFLPDGVTGACMHGGIRAGADRALLSVLWTSAFDRAGYWMGAWLAGWQFLCN